MRSNKWYWCTYLQGGNRDADIENRKVDLRVRGDELRDGDWHMSCVKQLVGICCIAQGAQFSAL